MGAWHGMSARGRRGLGGRVQKRLASREPMARRPAHPRPVWVWGESVKFGRPRPSHPLTRRSTFFSVVLGSGAGCPALAAARTARRWREEGRRHPMRVAGGLASRISLSGLPPPLPSAAPTVHCPAHCPLPHCTRTSHTPTESHTHTHTDSSVSVITRNFSTFAALPRPPRNPLHSPLLTQTMPRKFCASPPPARTLKSGI